MLTEQREQMNAIMRQAARRARRRQYRYEDVDLMEVWKKAIERLCVTIVHPDLRLQSDLTAEQLRQLCHDKPWSFERFVDYVNQRL